MIDLQERFDRAWAGEPAPMDARQQLTVAHRGLRRRRMVIATSVLGVVAVLGGTAAATGSVPGLTGESSASSAYAGHTEPGEVEVTVAQTPAELDQISSDGRGGRSPSRSTTPGSPRRTTARSRSRSPRTPPVRRSGTTSPGVPTGPPSTAPGRRRTSG